MNKIDMEWKGPKVTKKLVKCWQKIDNQVRRSAEVLRVPEEKLPETADRFMQEHKLLKKELKKNKTSTCSNCGGKSECIKVNIKSKKQKEKKGDTEPLQIRLTSYIKLIYVMKCISCDKKETEIIEWKR